MRHFISKARPQLYSKSSPSANLDSNEWDYIITMGCGDECPLVPGKKKVDWAVPDPKSLPLFAFRKVRNLIEVKVKELILHVQQNS